MRERKEIWRFLQTPQLWDLLGDLDLREADWSRQGHDRMSHRMGEWLKMDGDHTAEGSGREQKGQTGYSWVCAGLHGARMMTKETLALKGKNELNPAEPHKPTATQPAK